VTAIVVVLMVYLVMSRYIELIHRSLDSRWQLKTAVHIATWKKPAFAGFLFLQPGRMIS